MPGHYQQLDALNNFKWDFSEFSLIRTTHDLVASSDLLCNVMVFTAALQLKHKILNGHSRLISDIVFMQLPDQQTSLATCSHDGYLKVWDLQNAFRPFYEYTSSKKWCFGMLYDPSTLVLTLNAEGKHFPQKLFYFQK